MSIFSKYLQHGPSRWQPKGQNLEGLMFRTLPPPFSLPWIICGLFVHFHGTYLEIEGSKVIKKMSQLFSAVSVGEISQTFMPGCLFHLFNSLFFLKKKCLQIFLRQVEYLIEESMVLILYGSILSLIIELTSKFY